MVLKTLYEPHLAKYRSFYVSAFQESKNGVENLLRALFNELELILCFCIPEVQKLCWKPSASPIKRVRAHFMGLYTRSSKMELKTLYEPYLTT